MAFTLKLPALWEHQGWKIKVRDKERVEPPHATIMRRAQAWRWGLRSGTFLDREPDPREIPQELLVLLRSKLPLLCSEWDQMYPNNPVSSKPLKRYPGPSGKPKSRHK